MKFTKFALCATIITAASQAFATAAEETTMPQTVQAEDATKHECANIAALFAKYIENAHAGKQVINLLDKSLHSKIYEAMELCELKTRVMTITPESLKQELIQRDGETNATDIEKFLLRRNSALGQINGDIKEADKEIHELMQQKTR